MCSGSSSAPATGHLGISQDPQRIVVLDGLITTMEEPMDEPDARPEQQPDLPDEPAGQYPGADAGEDGVAPPPDTPYRFGAPMPPPPAGPYGPPLSSSYAAPPPP